MKVFQKFILKKINTSDIPYLLFYKGDINLLSDIKKNVAVIGVLNPQQDIEIREREFVKQIVNNNCNIVSGLAKGCDAIAHDQCLESGGKTIAILPSTLENIFPAENRALANKIIKNKGLLVTEYFTKPKGRFDATKKIY